MKLYANLFVFLFVFSIVMFVYAEANIIRPLPDPEDDPCCQVPQRVPCFAPCSKKIKPQPKPTEDPCCMNPIPANIRCLLPCTKPVPQI